jgi:hypothetical protein
MNWPGVFWPPRSCRRPGPARLSQLVPALTQGIVYDILFSALRTALPMDRAYVAILTGGLAGPCAAMAVRVAMGVPWPRPPRSSSASRS